MPTDTLGAAGRSRCAAPIGRARHPAECREAPGKSVEKPSRKRSLPTVSTGYANEESDSRRKRHIQGDNETHIETIRHADPARNAGRIAPTISGSRLTVPERISPARRPEASPPKRSGKEPSGSLSPKNYARQAGCRPGFSCGPLTRIRETISRPVPCLLPVLSLSLIRLGKPGRTKATASQGGGNPHAQSGRSDARARETDPKKETTPHAEPQRRSRSVVRTRTETADRENNDNRPAGTIRNRSETP